jgi:hypothetical protein
VKRRLSWRARAAAGAWELETELDGLLSRAGEGLIELGEGRALGDCDTLAEGDCESEGEADKLREGEVELEGLK